MNSTAENTLAATATGTYSVWVFVLHGATVADPNARAPKEVRLLGREMIDSAASLAHKDAPTLVRPSGSTSDDNAAHPENTDAPSDTKPVDSDTDESAEQLWNAPSPTLVTLLGSVTSSRPAQPANALAATLCTPVLIHTAPEQQAADGVLLSTQSYETEVKHNVTKRFVWKTRRDIEI